MRKLKFPATSKRLSFDAMNMFTRIPMIRAIKHLKNNNICPNTINEFSKVLTHRTTNILCVFQGSAYEFLDGLPLGDPLTMLVADIFMDNLEDENVHSRPHSRCIRHWRRYADDILSV